MLSLILAMNELILHVFLLTFAVLIMKTQLWKSFFLLLLFFVFWESGGSVGLSVYSYVKKKGKRFSDKTEYWIVAEDILIQNWKLSYSTFCGNFQISISRFYQKIWIHIIDGPEKDSKFLRPLTTLLCH